MRRTAVILVALSLLGALCACGVKGPPRAPKPQPEAAPDAGR